MTNAKQSTVATGAAVLWASAIVLVALIITSAAKINPGSAAYADVSEIADLTVLTTKSAPDNDVLAVLDRRSERIMVYDINQGRSVELYEIQDLSNLFAGARGNARR